MSGVEKIMEKNFIKMEEMFHVLPLLLLCLTVRLLLTPY